MLLCHFPLNNTAFLCCIFNDLGVLLLTVCGSRLELIYTVFYLIETHSTQG